MKKLFKEIFKKIKFRKWNNFIYNYWENIDIDLIIKKQRDLHISLFSLVFIPSSALC